MCRYLSYEVGRHPSQYHLLPLRTGELVLSSCRKYIHIQKTDMCDVLQLRLDPGMGQILSDGTGHCSQLWRVLLCAGSNTNQREPHRTKQPENKGFSIKLLVMM